jgi:GAF domain-containing protein
MTFAAALRKSLQARGSEVPTEFERGDSLEDVLNRHLVTVEQMGGDDVFTCILLLSPDGKRLSYGAAPTVPASYCRASESVEIGLRGGSCAAAAYLGRPFYSVDIATDRVWAGNRELALQHGFRSCWSTPIRNSDHTIIGTFAILHQKVGMPTNEEIEAIELITEHVANAIMWFRNSQHDAKPVTSQSAAPLLRLVSDNQMMDEPARRLVELAKKLHSKADDLDRFAARLESEATAQDLKNAAKLSRKLAANIMSQIEHIRPRNS